MRVFYFLRNFLHYLVIVARLAAIYRTSLQKLLLSTTDFWILGLHHRRLDIYQNLNGSLAEDVRFVIIRVCKLFFSITIPQNIFITRLALLLTILLLLRLQSHTHKYFWRCYLIKNIWIAIRVVFGYSRGTQEWLLMREWLLGKYFVVFVIGCFDEGRVSPSACFIFSLVCILGICPHRKAPILFQEYNKNRLI